MSINTPTAELAAKHSRWRRNRDVIEGAEAVKRRGTAYLPYVSSNQTPAEYDIYKANVSFFPAAGRTVDLLTGLIFRKRPVLTASRVVDLLANGTITNDGRSVEQLAHKVTRETLITNFTGLLVDHPKESEFSGLSAANAIAEGYRPFIGIYPAESILEVRYGTIRNQRKLVYVRLLDDEQQVRELVLENGVYVQRIHRDVDGTWRLIDETVPTVAGKPWSELPFVIVSTGMEQTPQPAMMDHCVELNLDHYLIQAKLSLVHRYLSTPIPYIIGASGSEVDEISVEPGSLWEFAGDKTQVEVDMLEHSGAGVRDLVLERETIEAHLHTIGARLLNSAPTKNVEAADTHKIKQASENSALATSARTIAQHIRTALNWFSLWVDGSNVDFSLNTDFMPGNATAQDVSTMLPVVQAGLMSRETFFYNVLRDGELVDETLTWEVEKARIEAEAALLKPVESELPVDPDAQSNPAE